MEISEIRVLMKYEFLRRDTTRQAVTNISSVFIIQVATNATVARWFKKFRSGYFDLSDEPRGRPETQVDSDILKATVEANSSESARELSLMYNKERRLDACLSLLSRNKAEPFLNQIVTCDETLILYDNRKCSSQWLDKDEPPKHCPKRDIHQKKLMVTVWWSGSAVIHHSFMEPGQSITADVYCYQLDEMMRNLAIKQPKLVNRMTPILLHDNARLHATRMTVSKLQELKLETLRHPPFSPDLTPTDYYFFQN
ncbi:histone-lysine N-methyltransferase SETMAR [Nephila pilipes]|uniref:Histone-lysine N-methyltransferase SETMAR n=1 Tax=Nephila pilipes TaxID=299642 RepID=A0A8X6NU35_NEPPI|nr:histone-lysine N-methyltransferase SETMAR [Nephila pilipes]